MSSNGNWPLSLNFLSRRRPWSYSPPDNSPVNLHSHHFLIPGKILSPFFQPTCFMKALQTSTAAIYSSKPTSLTASATFLSFAVQITTSPLALGTHSQVSANTKYSPQPGQSWSKLHFYLVRLPNGERRIPLNSTWIDLNFSSGRRWGKWSLHVLASLTPK